MDFRLRLSVFICMIQLSNISLFHLDLEDSFAKAYMQIRLKYGQTVFEVNRVIGGREAAKRGRAGGARVGQRSKQACTLCWIPIGVHYAKYSMHCIHVLEANQSVCQFILMKMRSVKVQHIVLIAVTNECSQWRVPTRIDNHLCVCAWMSACMRVHVSTHYAEILIKHCRALTTCTQLSASRCQLCVYQYLLKRNNFITSAILICA